MRFSITHRLSVLILVLGVLTTVLGITFAYAALNKPTHSTLTETVFRDDIVSTLNLRLVLYPNEVYEDETIYAETGRVYYIAIVNSVCPIYSIKANKGNMSGEILTNVILSHPDGWTKNLASYKRVINSNNLTFNAPCINISGLLNYVNNLSSQLGIKTYSFSVKIESESRFLYQYEDYKTTEGINNSLTISIDKNKNALLVAGEPTKTKTISKIDQKTFENKIVFMSVAAARATSIISTATGVLLILIGIISIYRQKTPLDPKTLFERSYRNLIIRAKQMDISANRVVKLQDQEDLLKTARILGKPIVKTVLNERQVFLVSDGEFFYILE